tara:strand:- start:78 stop:461 length:384 start_codon:yes stop_codon:yes gene_type:complete
MDTVKFFKNLIIIDALLFVIIIILMLFEPIEYADFMAETSVIISDTTFSSVALIALLVYIVSLFFCYQLKSLGKSLYLLSFIIGAILGLFSDVALTGLAYTVENVGVLLSGMIIYVMYFSDIKDKFN